MHIGNPPTPPRLGIEFVYQDLALADNLDITQNMFLGREINRFGLLSDGEMERKARETLSSLSVRTVSSVRQLVSSLSGGQRQTVAIAKAVLWNSKVVFLDEPTAALGVAQTRQVLDLVRRLADQGLGVVLISHNMNDVMEVADRVSALYLGRIAAEVSAPGQQRGADRRAHHQRPQRRHRPGRGHGGRGGSERHDRPDHRVPGRRRRHLGGPDATPPRPDRRRRSRQQAGRPSGRRSPSTSTDAAIADAVRDYVYKVRSGEPGALPSILGLVILAPIFSQVSGRFLTPEQHRQPARPGRLHRDHRPGPGVRAAARRDRPVRRHRPAASAPAPRPRRSTSTGLRHGHPRAPLALLDRRSALMLAAAALGFYLKSITGPVLVLIGVVITLTGLDQHTVPAIVFAIAVGCAVGIFTGWLVASVGIPSFIVTLALFLAWQGVLLFVLNTQPIGVNGYHIWFGLAHGNMSPARGAGSSRSWWWAATSPTRC